MEGLVPLVLASWVVLTVGFFWKRPGRSTALLALLGGWAVLPTGIYRAPFLAHPGGPVVSVHALAVPTELWLNKALVIGVGCLVGVVLFDWAAVLRQRPDWRDAPMLVWCLVPMASTLANGLPLATGLALTRYLVLAWGVPYALGRIYLGGNEELRQFGLGLVVAGLVSLPLAVLEFVWGPFLYTSVYGRHPYETEGAQRLLGHRPLLFFEHGNQFGVWIAVAAVAAIWLHGSGRMPSVARMPGATAAIALVAACLVFQSLGAISLMLAVVLVVVLLRQRERFRFRARRAYAAVAAGVLVLALTGSVAVAAAEAGGWSGLRNTVRGFFRDIGKASFTWRLARSEENVRRIAERPLLGWGRADWSAAAGGTFVNPVNIGWWVLAAGMFGAVGVVSAATALMLPPAEALWKVPVSAWLHPRYSALVLTTLLLLIVAIDAALNSVVLLPFIAGAGGLNSWLIQATAVRPRD
jgi:hypothetical protein